MKAVLLLFAGLLGYAGLACLALAIADNWHRAGGRPEDHPRCVRQLRLCALPMLCVAAAACVWRDGAGFGLLLWALLMSADAVAVALTLTWAPGRLGWFIRLARSAGAAARPGASTRK